MNHHFPVDHDVIVVGGSFAGISAAIYVARARRTVCVIDAGAPRNRFAAHSHGLFGHDGLKPADMLANARAQLAAYPEVTFIEDSAVDAKNLGDRFSVTLSSGETRTAARLVLAYGMRDELPAIPGLAERWGATVAQCPYCHGYEFGGQRLGVLYHSPLSLHHATLVGEWGPAVLFLNGATELDQAQLAKLTQRGIDIEPAPVARLVGEGQALSAVELADGRTRAIDALFLGSTPRFNSDIAERLGCAIDEGTAGSIIRTDATKMTTVPGVFAAGDITRLAYNVTWACSDGVMAGSAAHRSLVFPEEVMKAA
ncbi:MAG: NAD(P)/FAD-dependent oxidoreductase [Pseudomonadota bacterium]|nr:NAD(P)/FAD-dependent oxidoreductase [Pseudomonadota bacterium]